MKRIVFVVIILFLFLSGCKSLKESTGLSTPVPDPSSPPSLLDAGKFWFVPEEKEIKVKKSFVTEIHINTGTQRLAAYGIKINYDEKRIMINTRIGTQGVIAGENGFISAAIITEPGTLVVSGFNARGIDPGSDLHLLTLFWRAKNRPGSTNISLLVESFVDTITQRIGNPISSPCIVHIKK